MAMFASGSYNNIKIWNFEDGTLIKTLNGHNNSFQSVNFSPDSSKIISGDNTIKIWNVENGELINTFNGHGSFVF